MNGAGIGLGPLLGLVVLFAAVVWLAVVIYRPVRAAARGDLGPDGSGGMRTSTTLRSPEAWQLGHRAAMIYVGSLPWVAGIAVLGGILGTVWGGAVVGVTIGLVALAVEVFVYAMGWIFAHVAAR